MITKHLWILKESWLGQQNNKFDNLDVTQLVHPYFTVLQSVRLTEQVQLGHFLNKEINYRFGLRYIFYCVAIHAFS